MRTFFPLFVLLITVVESCCWGVQKCPVYDPTISIRVVDSQTGVDLLFGPTAIYDKSRFRIFSLNGSDSVFYSYSLGSLNLTDSAVYTSFLSERPGKVYIDYNNGDLDTLITRLVISSGGHCCDGVEEILVDSLNEQPYYGSTTPVLIRK